MKSAGIEWYVRHVVSELNVADGDSRLADRSLILADVASWRYLDGLRRCAANSNMSHPENAVKQRR